jgi:hypothetical protein
MKDLAIALHHCFRSRPIAAGVASVFALAAPSATFASTTWPVTSCLDSGVGSLRTVVTAVTTVTGDTVSLAGLSCPGNKIALTSAPIGVGRDNLTIVGPGKNALEIDATALDTDGRVFDHAGAGTLTVQDLHVSGGQVYRGTAGQVALGGCIFSTANVSLKSVIVSGCNVTSMQDNARGGGVYATGTLTIDHSEITGNTVYSGAGSTKGARGGGIASKGLLKVTNSTVSGNSTNAPSGFSLGGGVFTSASAEMKSAVVSGNSAISDHGASIGGGINTYGNLDFDYGLIASNSAILPNQGGGCGSAGAAVNGNFAAKYSTIDSNQAIGLYTQTSTGGLGVRGDMTLEGSTVSNNSATGFTGGIDAFDNGNFDRKVFLRNSTVSGNHAKFVGGLRSTHKNIQIYNSTIAFNTAELETINNYALSPGIQISSSFQDVAVKMQSTIVSNNTFGAGVENDFGSDGSTFAVSVTMTNTLLRASSVATVPTVAACPLLGPLRDNGGPTQTHALLSHSPAIDAGDNVLKNPQDLPWGFDQRGGTLVNGTFDYARESGARADMGAPEVQQGDTVFDASFEGCPAV